MCYAWVEVVDGLLHCFHPETQGVIFSLQHGVLLVQVTVALWPFLTGYTLPLHRADGWHGQQMLWRPRVKGQTWKNKLNLNLRSYKYATLNQTECCYLQWPWLYSDVLLRFQWLTLKKSRCFQQRVTVNRCSQPLTPLHYFHTQVTSHPLLPHRGQLAIPQHSHFPVSVVTLLVT